MIIARASCPHCAAPLALADGQRHALCGYCDASLQIATAPGQDASAPAVTRRPDVPPAEVDRVKQLVLDGKRTEAIAHYGRVAGLAPAEATAAVDQLMWPAIGQMIRHMPLNAFGFALYGVLIGGFGAAAAWAITRGLAGAWWAWLIAAPAALLAARSLAAFAPKARSAWVAARGARGRARVVKRVVVRPTFVRGGSIVVVAFSVEPEAGGAPFLDEEVLLLRDESIPKLDPGNVVPVRYDEPGRRRVFPISPIEVVGRVDRVTP
jgi:hypothetical protein